MTKLLRCGSLIVFAFPCAGQDPEVCKSINYDRPIAAEELKSILELHQARLGWIDAHEDDRSTAAALLLGFGNIQVPGAFADLTGADLRDADLSHRDLRGVSLRCADLRRADLSGTNLGYVWPFRKMEGAKLKTSDLAGADLRGANLTGTRLNSVYLARSRIGVTGLPPRTYYLRGLGSGYVTDQDSPCDENQRESKGGAQWTKMDKADLTDADFFEATLDADLDSLPPIKTLSLAKNLDTVAYCGDPNALVVLREEFKKEGFRDQGRQLTFAIRHEERLAEWPVMRSAAYFLFEFPSRWGMDPARPPLLIAAAIILFSLFYARALNPASTGRLWVVYSSDRVERFGESIPPERLTSEWRNKSLSGRWYGLALRQPRLWLLAFSFSLNSAFAIGWRDLNFGSLISRIHPRELSVRATGWTRTLSGIQSIVCVYLLALWVLSYFGTPFDY